ncbi:autotransporter domain-containing protein [Gramella sp. AN32]|uniref:Autotransporter domain-containing protein n=1 Tax=Christiangramia antarctica TaxID=2058158 RepID=A0ABW5X0F8_9FLAO|nr:autotransporter domain-containing protein [Gramella sp. AN32]MCM4155049.1 hypothetical protein [Gramella sp. AN32]
MRSNIKVLIAIIFPVFLFGQELEKNESNVKDTTKVNMMYSPGNPESVAFNIGFFRPIGLGNSAMAEAYTYKNPGFEFTFNWFVQQHFTIGASVDYFNGMVEDRSKVGEISRTGVASLSAHLGYYKAITREWYWHVLAGYGYVSYSSKSAEDRFLEEGNMIFLRNEIGHRFTKTLAVYGKIELRNDFMDVITSRELDNYFNSNLFLNLGIGLRINLQNPDG